MKSIKQIIMLLLVVVLAACQQSEDLETSVNNRWAGIINDELDQAYEYFSPGYREIENLQSFMVRIATAKINMNWQSVKFKNADCESEDVCQVSVDVEYLYKFPRRSMGEVKSKSVVTENWIRLDGRWYHVPKSSELK